jgi:hypothetical protein
MTKSKILIAVAAALVLGAGAAVAQNTLAVNAGAALGGTNFGMEITTAAGATNSVYVQSDHPASETHMIIRWRMRLGSLTAPASGPGRNFRLMNMIDTDAPALPHKVFFLQRQTTTGNWRLAVWTYDTGISGYAYAGGHFVVVYGTATDIREECEWTMDSGAGDGALTCTRLEPAGQSFSTTTLVDAGRQTDSVALGFFDFDNFNSVGNIDLDEYESYR